MAIPTKEVKGSRGKGLDFRSAPDVRGGGAAAPTGPDDPVVARLSEMAQDAFGAKPDPQTANADQKKNPATESQSRGGTTQNGSTGTVDPGPSTFRSDAVAGSSGASGNVDGGSSRSASAGNTDSAGTAAPGGEVDAGEEGAPETLDALSLLNKGIQQPEALGAKPDAATDGPKTPEPGVGKPRSEGSALRTQLEKTIAENRDLAKRLKELETRDDPRVKEVTTAWEAEKKAREAAEARIAHLDYSQSAEFKERFVAPYEAAASDTLKQLRSMATEEGAKLTQDELETIMVGGEKAAYQLIDSKFSGADATIATGWVKDLYALDRVRYRALESAKNMAVERQKQGQAQAQARQEKVKMLWEKERDGRMAAAKDLFERPPGDKARGRLLDEGAVLADAAFFRPPNVSDEQAIAIMAEVRNRATALPALKADRDSWKAKAEAFEARLRKYEGHAPGNGEPGEETSVRTSKHEAGTMEFAIEQLRELAS